MKLPANISAGAVARAMGHAEMEGATVQSVNITVRWKREGMDGIASFRRNGGDRLIVAHAEIDDADAKEKLGLSPWDWEDDEAVPSLNDADLHDFISCCLVGDRHGALALTSRLFDGRNASTAEQLLLAARRFA